MWFYSNFEALKLMYLIQLVSRIIKNLRLLVDTEGCPDQGLGTQHQNMMLHFFGLINQNLTYLCLTLAGRIQSARTVLHLLALNNSFLN